MHTCLSQLVSHRHHRPSSHPRQTPFQPRLLQRRMPSARNSQRSLYQTAGKSAKMICARPRCRQHHLVHQPCPSLRCLPAHLCCVGHSSCRCSCSYSFLSWWWAKAKGGFLHLWRCKVLKNIFHRCNVCIKIVLWRRNDIRQIFRHHPWIFHDHSWFIPVPYWPHHSLTSGQHIHSALSFYPLADTADSIYINIYTIYKKNIYHFFYYRYCKSLIFCLHQCHHLFADAH